MTVNMIESREGNDDAGDSGVGGTHSGVSVIVGVAFERG